MANFALTDVTAWVHSHDFTGDSNQLKLMTSVDELEKTTFGSTFKQRTGGLKDTDFELSGYWQSATTDAVDVEIFPDLGTANRVVTVAPTSAEGSTAYFARLGKFTYELGGDIGAMMPYALTCMGTDKYGLIRGQVAAAVQSVSATGAFGSGVQLGAAASGQYVYAVLHVFSAGTTVTVDVESDDNSGFTTATTVGTLGPITTTGGTWLTRVAGPITDTYYRFNVTAVTGTFSLAGAIGVQ